MSIEIIKKVTETERIAQESRLEADVNAKKAIAEAERAGREILAEARGKAEQQVRQIMKEAEMKAAENEESIIEETKEAGERLRIEAQARLPQAAKFIVERVVNV